MHRFDGRVAIVTGAGAGLGRCHALLLAERGATVVVNDISAAAATAVAAEIAAAGGRTVADSHSVAMATGASALVDGVLDAFGRVDVVVNNAGVLRSADMADMTEELWDEVLAVHLHGGFRVLRAAWPHMASAGYGRVVNTTSNSGLLGIAGSTAYAAAKAGLYGLTRVLALEGRDLGIHVNAVAPVAYTAMSASSRAAPQAWKEGGDAWARELDPARVSPVVAWLAHEECELTGEVLSAGAGQVSRFFLGLTRGFRDAELDVESVREHMTQIRDETGYAVLGSAREEFLQLHRGVMGGGPDEAMR